MALKHIATNYQPHLDFTIILPIKHPKNHAGMNLATDYHCDISLFKSAKKSNIQLTIKSMIMNRKQNQVGLTHLKLMDGHLIKSQILYQLS